MNSNLMAILAVYFATYALIVVVPGWSMHTQERYEHELKMACINAGKTLIDGSCIDGETK